MGEPGDDPVCGIGQFEPFEQVMSPVLPALRHPAQFGGELEMLPGRGPRDESADVGAVTDKGADTGRITGGVHAGNDHAARCRRQNSGQDAHRRRLSGTVAADECDAGAAGDGQVESVHRAHGAEIDNEALSQEHRVHVFPFGILEQ